MSLFTKPAPGCARTHAYGLTRAVDPSTGIIIVEGRGLWSPEAADDHFEAMAALIRQARTKPHGVRVLIDLRAAAVQTTDTSRSIQDQSELLYEPQDWVAIVLSSSLLAMQMRRVSGAATYRHFNDPCEARSWLLGGSGC